MSRGWSAAQAWMSAPAQNARSPAPVRITTRTSRSASSRRAAFSSASSITGVSVLSLSGRFRVTVASAPSMAVCTLSSATAPPGRFEHQSHRRGLKNGRSHRPQVVGNPQGRLGLVEDLFLQVHAGSEFRDHHPPLPQNTYPHPPLLQNHAAALRDIADLLLALLPHQTAETDVLGAVDELFGLAFLQDAQFAVADF